MKEAKEITSKKEADNLAYHSREYRSQVISGRGTIVFEVLTTWRWRDWIRVTSLSGKYAEGAKPGEIVSSLQSFQNKKQQREVTWYDRSGTWYPQGAAMDHKEGCLSKFYPGVPPIGGGTCAKVTRYNQIREEHSILKEIAPLSNHSNQK